MDTKNVITLLIPNRASVPVTTLVSKNAGKAEMTNTFKPHPGSIQTTGSQQKQSLSPFLQGITALEMWWRSSGSESRRIDPQ